MIPIVCNQIIVWSPSLLFIGIILFLTIYYCWKTSYWSRNGIPGPKSIPFVGNAFDIMFKPSFLSELDYVKRYGKIVGVYHGSQPNLIVADPDLIRLITVKEFTTFPESFGSPYKAPLEEKFLTTLYGDEWKRVRSLLTPAFTTGKLRKVFDLIKGCMVQCLDDLKGNNLSPLNGQNGKKSTEDKNCYIDMKHFWGRYNMDVTAKCFFAVNLQVYSKDRSLATEALNSFRKVFLHNMIRFLINTMTPDWFIRLTRTSQFSIQGLNYLFDLTHAVIRTRRGQPKGSNGVDYNDFLQLLLESEDDLSNGNCNQNHVNHVKQKLSTDEIVSSAVVFLLAGYETTSTLLTWACYELAKNPEIQDKLYHEISSMDEINYETIKSCDYLEAVINETLRFHPPIIQLPRIAHSDYHIPGTKNAILPKGSKAFISIYSVHHNPEYYPEPDVYRPERFLPPNRDLIQPFTFIPFGCGPRLCIGMRFALLNAKMALALFLKEYELVDNCFTTKRIEYSKHNLVLTAKEINIGIERRSSKM